MLPSQLPSQLPVLQAGPVRLRPFAPRDVDLVVSVASDPLIPLITTVPDSGSADQALAYIERQHQRLGVGRGYSFAIADADSDRGVGQIGVWLRDYVEGRVSLGYWIGPAFRGRGYARAALAAATGWALTLDAVHRAELYVEPWNEASWRIAERVGYQREGLLRGWQRVGGRPRDMFMYSRLLADGPHPAG